MKTWECTKREGDDLKGTWTKLGNLSSVSFIFWYPKLFTSDLGTIIPLSLSFLQFSTAFRRSVFRSFFSNFFCSSSSFNQARFRSAALIRSSLNGHRFGTARRVFFRFTFRDGLMPIDSNCLACFLDLSANDFFFLRINFFVDSLARFDDLLSVHTPQIRQYVHCVPQIVCSSEIHNSSS